MNYEHSSEYCESDDAAAIPMLNTPSCTASLTQLAGGNTSMPSAIIGQYPARQGFQWEEGPLRFRPSKGLNVLVKYCPNVKRLDCLYEERREPIYKLCFRRGPTGTWNELGMDIGAIPAFIQMALPNFVSETVFSPELPELVLTCLAIDKGKHAYSQDDLHSLVQWIQPYIENLRKLDTGPNFFDGSDFIRISDLLRPTISTLCLHGYVTDRTLAGMISSLPELRDIAFRPRLLYRDNETLPLLLQKALKDADLDKATFYMSSLESVSNSSGRPGEFALAIFAGSSRCDIRVVNQHETLFSKKPWSDGYTILPSDYDTILDLEHALNNMRHGRPGQFTSETPSEPA